MKEVWAEGQLGKKGGQPRVIFGQVHEDASCELAAAREAANLRRCVVIGSGGCTAFSLLASEAAIVDAVDINPAQIYMIEAKRAALRSLPFEQIQRAFEYNASPFLQRLREDLSDEAREFWERNQSFLQRGFLQCGVIDRSMRKAMQLFFWTVRSRREVTALLQLADAEAQNARFQRRWTDWRWHTTFNVAFHPWLLAIVYGPDVLRRLPANAAQSVRDNLETALTRLPARNNGYLWQTFLQRYPAENDDARPLYLQPAVLESIRGKLDSLHLHCGDLAAWLAEQAPESIDFFALSNILELAPSQFAETLTAQIVRTGTPGAVVVTRQIFAGGSGLQHPSLRLDSAASACLDAKDRSPICRNIRLYRRNPIAEAALCRV